jgi:hypothetical protein
MSGHLGPVPATFFTQLLLKEEHARSTVDLILLTLTEILHVVNMSAVIKLYDIHHTH